MGLDSAKEKVKDLPSFPLILYASISLEVSCHRGNSLFYSAGTRLSKISWIVAEFA